MDEFEIEIKEGFLSESVDLLEKAEEAFLELEHRRDDPELINSIFRLAHNLKGTSRAVGFEQLAELTHIAENLILKIKDGDIAVTDPVVSILLAFKDKVQEMVEGLSEDLEATFELSDIITNLEKLTNNTEPAGSGEPEVTEAGPVEVPVEVSKESEAPSASLFGDDESEVPSASLFDDDTSEVNNDEASSDDVSGLSFFDQDDDTDEKSDNVVALSEAAIESMRELGNEIPEELLSQVKKENSGTLNFNNFPEGNAVVEEKKTIVHEVVAKPEETVAAAKKPKRKTDEDESIRVKLSRIDQINNIIGELVILQTVLYQRRYEYIKDDLSNNSIGQMSKLFKEAQELAMSLRMLPLKTTFQKMNRIVRDTSKALDKQVDLIIEGEDTEVDKTILEQIADPLVHIIRNAVDHGLETTEGRLESGKSLKGKVWLRAYHEGSNLIIEVRDDGKGIPPDIIRRKAIENKIITENQQISDFDLINLIFHPGFSTKEEVTEVSGRGVGMDVVKTNIEKIGGEASVQSTVGKGSIFKISLPLTLAIIDGLVITSNEQRYVVPLSQIFEVITLDKSEITSVSGGGDLFELRGEVLPLFVLNKKLGRKGDLREKNITVIMRGLDYAVGVSVDAILNQQQIVIKTLGEDIRATKGMMGSAILGDGKPALILDLFEIFQKDFKQSKSYQNLVNNVSAA